MGTGVGCVQNAHAAAAGRPTGGAGAGGDVGWMGVAAESSGAVGGGAGRVGRIPALQPPNASGGAGGGGGTAGRRSGWMEDDYGELARTYMYEREGYRLGLRAARIFAES